MTGRHPMRNGITHTILERERLTLDAVTLPQTLKSVGYTSGIFGKWHLGDEDAYSPTARGFDEAFIHGGGGIGQKYECSCADAPDNTYFHPWVRHNGQFVKTQGFCTDVFFQAATQWMDQKRQEQEPFFAYISTNAPHAPYIAPEKNVQRFKALGFDDEAANFYGMIENIDENVGRLIDAMKEMRLLENTLIIFMSDNGMTGMRGGLNQPVGRTQDGQPLYHFNAGMKGLKGSVDEGGVRVPFFVRWDGHIQAGRSLSHVVSHIDVFPTLAEIAGAALPKGQVEGRSMLALLDDPHAAWEDRYLFDHVGRWPTGSEPNDFKWTNYTVRSAGFRLVDGDSLYDMTRDPGQTKNCIEQHPDIAKAMNDAYDRWWETTRPRMINENAPMSATQPFHEAFKLQMAQHGIKAWVGNTQP